MLCVTAAPRSQEEEDEQLAAAIAASLGELRLDDDSDGNSLAAGSGGPAQAGHSSAAAGLGAAGPSSAAAEPEGEPEVGAAAPEPRIHVAAGRDVIFAVDLRGCCHRRRRTEASSSSTPCSAAAAAQPGDAPASPSPPGEPSEGGDWAYAVWSIGGAPQLCGVHVGSLRAWNWIRVRLPGQRYSFPICRLRRFPSEVAAVAGYIAEARLHGSPVPPPIFRH